MASVLSKELLVTLSFHAKIHSMLGFSTVKTPEGRKKEQKIKEVVIKERIKRKIDSIIEKIEKKILSTNNIQKKKALEELKKEALSLKASI